MDISVNKPAKDYLKNQFGEWYSEMVMQQLKGKDIENIEGLEILPINLGIPVLSQMACRDGGTHY